VAIMAFPKGKLYLQNPSHVPEPGKNIEIIDLTGLRRQRRVFSTSKYPHQLYYMHVTPR
jgi:hypothetical protein